jgi:hypothetical protein
VRVLLVNPPHPRGLQSSWLWWKPRPAGRCKDKAGGTELRLRGGKASVVGQIAATDPPDRVRQGSRCKVYTLRMVQGATYRIDPNAPPGRKARPGLTTG